MAVILVADDEEMIRALAKAALASAGHEVLTAANGLEAVALYRSFPKLIALVITDMKMPLMDGHGLLIEKGGKP
jgi:two-component system cell cycle response regulator CpdR